MDPELEAMLTIPVSVQPYTGKDAHGNATYGTAVVIDGFVDSVRRLVGTPGDKDGVGGRFEEVSIPLLVIDGEQTTVPSVDDKVTAKDEVYNTMVVTLFYDDGEPHHYEIELSKKD